VSYAIQSVLDQKYYDYELVVSVNHSRDETLHEIISLQDDHIKLLIPPSELSMSKHYEFILAHASGEWVTILGDDDALMPYFFLEADKLIENNPGPKLVSSQRAYYFWEGCQELYGDTVVDFKGFEGGNIKLSKVAMILSLLGLESYMSLPQLYTTGLFHKSLIQKIKDISDGNFYHSITPDAYSCVVGLLTTNQFIHSNLPLFWVGSSPKSTGFSHTASKLRSPSPKDENFYKDSSAGSAAYDFHSLALADKLSINPSISKNLFLSGYNSLYTYEALLQCPFANDFLRSRLVRYLFFASIFTEFVGRECLALAEHPYLFEEKLHLFFSEAVIGKTGIFWIVIFIPLVGLAKVLLSILLKVSKLVGTIRPRIRFRSNCHNTYPTILDASRHIEQMLASGSFNSH
jgi:glycosyltransferase involved in cell wall biosynthesis